jgi:hypothetical protein
MKKILKVLLYIIVGIWALGFIIMLIDPPKSVAKQLSDDSKFNYSTSITSNYDKSDKAKVYSTNMSVEDTARYLIDEDRPIEYTDLYNDEAIQLIYDDYYVLIYDSEDEDETYVQISSRKYIHHNGYNGLYRPHRNNIILFYNNSYTSSRYFGKDSSRYGNGYTKPVKTVSTPVKSDVTTSDKPKSTKIQTDKNSSSKIRTQSSKPKTSTSSSSSSTSTSKSSSSSTSRPRSSSSSLGSSSNSYSSSSSSRSIRSGSSSSRSSLGGGTSFGK